MASQHRSTSNGQNACCRDAGGDNTGRGRFDRLGSWRDGRIQVTLVRFLRIEEVEIVTLDDRLARACGELCGATETTDMIDASVVIVTRLRGDHIISSDPRDLRRLDPTCPIILSDLT